jgi:hypothetical protein
MKLALCLPNFRNKVTVGELDERRQRADPPAPLDEDDPDRGRHVDPRDARTAEREETAEDDEENEREMRDEDEVGENAVEHRRDPSVE